MADQTMPLSSEDRRWLHDKYQALDHDEAELASYRTSFIAVITTALVAALVYAVANVLPRGNLLFAVTTTFLAAFGLVLSAFWALVLWRTSAAQGLWRESARELERLQPPIGVVISASVHIRPSTTMTVDLARPYIAHEERFATSPNLPRFDRVNPLRLTNELPLFLIAIWIAVLVGAWLLVILRGP